MKFRKPSKSQEPPIRKSLQSREQDVKSSTQDVMSCMVDSGKANPSEIRTKYAMNLKNQLKELLRSRGITPAELSRRSGVRKQTLSLWLSGSTPKRLDEIKKVADALSVSADLLLFGDGVEPVTKPLGDIGAIIGDEWLTGAFEIKIRRIKNKP